MRNFFLLLFLFAASLTAQTALTVTAVPPGQIKGSPNSSGLLWVVLPSGMIAQADLGPGIVLDLSGARPVIRVQLPPMPRTVSGETLTLGGPGNRTAILASMPVAKSLKLYQNGIRQKEGGDYTISGSTITFHASYGDMVASNALVVADYEVAP